jgi:hypothetical protein
MAVPRAGNSEATPIEEWVFEDFGSINTKVPRAAVPDNEFAWSQNWMPIGVGRMRTLYAEGSTLINAGSKTIIYVYAFNLNSVSYWAVFYSDGTAVQVSGSGATTTISSVSGTFYGPANGYQAPACAQFQNKYLAIVNTLQQSNYWIWDGTSLYGCVTASGTATASLSPDYTIANAGLGYTSAPTVAITAPAGGGTTATATATVKNGSVTALTFTNPGAGYALNEQPVVTISGGGSDTQASATATLSTTTGGVSAIYITNGGTGYTTASVLTFAGGGGGSGAQAVITGLSNGAITAIAIVNAGTGYTSAPTVSASVGASASFVVQVASGQVTAVSVTTGGSGYYGDPAVSIVGDGTGAVVTAVVAGGAVTGFTVVAPGKNYTRAAVIISGGNKSATVTVSLMPIGTSGTTVETYQNRVWIGNGINLLGSGPNTVANFATSAGGVLAQLTDSSLRAQITRIAQSSGYLYIFGDSSITVLTNVQTSTAGVTSYNLANVDPQVGTSWRDSVTAFGRALVFANPSGVYALYGGAAEKVSAQLDGLFLNANYSATIPASAVATIYNIRVFTMLMTTVNPYTGASQSMMVMWDGQKWFTSTQIKQPLFIQTQEIGSNIVSWGTDGKNLYPMFQTASSSLPKNFQTKLRKAPNYTSFKRALRFFFVTQNNGAENNPSFTLAADTDLLNGTPQTLTLLQNSVVFSGSGTITFTGAASAPINFAVVPPVDVDGIAISAYGRLLGYTLTTNASDLDIISFTTQYGEFAPFG